ncbi:MAG: hypothetical protein ACI35S_01305, partial [Anaeroplasma sp.]
MFLINIENLLKNKQNQIFILSIIFVAIIVLLWLFIILIKKRIKKQKYYKNIAKQQLVSLGITEFEDNDKNSKKNKNVEAPTIETEEKPVAEAEEELVAEVEEEPVAEVEE